MKTTPSPWQLIRPYWSSEEKWRAWGLLALIIVLDLGTVYCAVQISTWQKNFFDALSEYQRELISPLMWRLAGLIALTTFCATFSIFFRQLLEIRWRSWVTEDYLARWTRKHAYQRIESARLADNPDQRIAEDLALMAGKTLDLGLGLLKNLVNAVSFAVILWGLSGSLPLTAIGLDIELPGYMLWAAILYAALGSWLMEKIGKPMVGLDYRQQQYEADFRYLLVRMRENAEQIAFYRGEAIEHNRLRNAFHAIRQNWRGLMTYTKRVAFTESVYIEVGSILPYLISIPRYFAKQITIGGVMQLSVGFSRLRTALSWFLFNYKELALLRSALRRLGEFDAVLRQPQVSGIRLVQSEHANLRTHGLNLQRPDGSPLSAIADIEVRPGERWLVRGPSGIGKSTLLRALAGLWPYGDGRIELPRGSQLFLPQKSYLPPGSLKDALCYPAAAETFDDAQCARALGLVQLPQYTKRLHESDHWEKRLSPGEQQRLAFARVLLHRPDYLFLDEASSALDAQNEDNLYRLLDEHLPASTVVSVAHHASLERYHQRRLDIG
ncbi:ABC transporter ATP-binding protein/permease [Stutzerimonas kirkiae]|uniref:ABC transporter permease n=1 Tax=Stutzerimonas kirkiae TaxID=2211392 RepID=A0A4Q9R404_9GAMM|nr:ABC transporter ATP-binding protein/permease [Stutzerimonas kirkiae]TBU92825.1 ABC transporter permease [Stutzerimonas kirkiae]TBV01288.1 ABC transporter permease [Stutzerimonas kirkiae]TBV10748.1 ABC transporter permease [Stutzerimonas kirkiae]TBV14540.1 ABC transporter permease [Stutzerimonas kirkiae]